MLNLDVNVIDIIIKVTLSMYSDYIRLLFFIHISQCKIKMCLEQIVTRTTIWSGNLFLIAPFPDSCLLVPF